MRYRTVSRAASPLLTGLASRRQRPPSPPRVPPSQRLVTQAAPAAATATTAPDLTPEAAVEMTHELTAAERDVVALLVAQHALPTWLAVACVQRLHVRQLMPIQDAALDSLRAITHASRPVGEGDVLLHSDTGSGKTLVRTSY
jgi:hypothetical protein